TGTTSRSRSLGKGITEAQKLVGTCPTTPNLARLLAPAQKNAAWSTVFQKVFEHWQRSMYGRKSRRTRFPFFLGPWALVTGASSSIGAEAARQLEASGLHLVLTARKKQALDDLAAELESGFGIKTRTIVADLREDNFLESLVAATDDIEVGL